MQILVIYPKQKRKKKKGSRQSKASTADILHGFALRFYSKDAEEERVVEQTTVPVSRQKTPNHKTEFQASEKRVLKRKKAPESNSRTAQRRKMETFSWPQDSEGITVQNESQLKRRPSKMPLLLQEKPNLPEK